MGSGRILRHQGARAGIICIILTDHGDRRRLSGVRTPVSNNDVSPGEVAPTREQWLALHRSFQRYCEAAPWECLANEDLLVVEDPEGRYQGYCVALGDGDMVYGLGVYLGDVGLSNFLSTISDEDEPDGQAILERQLSLSAMLADREELEPKERKIIRDLGLKYRGRGKWPMFRSARPGYWPWFVNGDEARFLTVALDTVRDVAERVARGELELRYEETPGLFLARVPEGSGWKDEWRRLAPPVLAKVDNSPDGERLRVIRESTPVGSAAWEVTVSYMPALIRHGTGDRPYMPTLVMVVEHDRELVLACRVLGETPSAAERQEPVLELLTDQDSLPELLVCDGNGAAELMAPIATALGIELFVGPTLVLDALREDLISTILQ